MRRYQIVAIALEREPEAVLWEGSALDPEDAMREALAQGVRLSLGRPIHVRDAPGPDSTPVTEPGSA